MSDQLSQLRDKIEHISEDARFSAFYEIMSSKDESIHGELDRIIQGNDPILKILFCRFLANVHQERAIFYLRKLLCDSNSIVFESAKIAFEKNKYDIKVSLLLTLLRAESRIALFYAIEKLSMAGVGEAVDIFLDKIDASDVTLSLKILYALRQYRERRILNEVVDFLKHDNAELRYACILLFGTLIHLDPYYVRRKLVVLLEDEDARNRQAALWALRRRPNKKNLKNILYISKNDPDPRVRQESILELGIYKTKKIILHLFHLLVSETDNLVLLKIETALLGMPLYLLKSLIPKILRHKHGKDKNKVLLILSEALKDDRNFAQYIYHALDETTDQQDLITLINCLAFISNQQSIEVLETYLDKESVLAYSAMMSLIQIATKNQFLGFIKYLKDPRLSVLLKEIALRSIVKHRPAELEKEEYVQYMYAQLSHKNINIRYLCIEALKISGRLSGMSIILRSFYAERDPIVKDNMKSLLMQIIEGDGGVILRGIEQNFENEILVNDLLDITHTFLTKYDSAMHFLKVLLGPPVDLLESPYKDRCIIILSSLLVQEVIFLEELLPLLHSNEILEDLMDRVLSELHALLNHKISLPYSFIESHFSLYNQSIKEKWVELLAFGREEEALFLMVGLCKSFEQDNSIKGIGRALSIAIQEHR